MNAAVTTDHPTLATGNLHDRDYAEFLGRFSSGFGERNCRRPLFGTDADNLWDTYLAAFPEGPERQHHTCHACRHFITRFGGLAYINDDGTLESAVWRENAPAFEAMRRAVVRAKVTGVFASSLPEWGTGTTGVWRHLAIRPPEWLLWRGHAVSADQHMAAKREAFGMVCRTLADYTPANLDAALALIRSDSLYRGEKVLAPAQWLRDLAGEVAARRGNARTNLIWRAVATAPEGFCHVRSGVLGTLLDDIKSGADAGAIAARFKEKMHPLQYQRPTAAPSDWAIDAAEKLVEKLGLAPALSRRFATMADIPPSEILWAPKEDAGTPTPAGVFGHLKKEETPGRRVLSPESARMTWAKFSRTVLPGALMIEVSVLRGARGRRRPQTRGGRSRGIFRNYGETWPFGILTTAVDPSAPPILQWDREDRRNPVCWYGWHGGSTEQHHGLTPGEYHPVSAIVESPCHWGGNEAAHFERKLLFVIPGAKETRNPGMALFPETLKSELHGIRSVVEAHSRKTALAGLETGNHVVGLAIPGTTSVVRVWSASNVATEYIIDRLD